MAMYGARSSFDLDAHFKDISNFNASMNDPENFRKRKIAMMNSYELPKLQAEMQGRMGIQQEANKPAIAKLKWDQSPENYEQHKGLMAMQTQPAMNQVQLAREQMEYKQSPQAVWQQEQLTKASTPPLWQFNPYESEYYDARTGQKKKAAGPLGAGNTFGGSSIPGPGAALPDNLRKKYGPGSQRGVARPSYAGDPDFTQQPTTQTATSPYSPYDEEDVY